jgi:hypothetical protein
MTTPLLLGFHHSDFLRHSTFVLRYSLLLAILMQLDPRKFSHKICCDLAEARLVASKFFKIVLGGTAALHACRVWGAVIF